MKLTDEQVIAIDKLDSALCNFLNNVGDEYDPTQWIPSVKGDLAALSKCYNECHRLGVMDLRQARLEIELSKAK